MDRIRKGIILFNCLLLLAGVAAADMDSQEQKNALEQLNTMSSTQFAALVKRASSGEPTSQTLLGIAYMQGVKVPQNYSTSLELFQKAARKRNGVAENNLGLHYFHGYGTAKDFMQAVKFFRKAGQDGSTNAHFNLGLMYHHGYGVKQDMEEAAKWYEVAALEGDAVAQNTLGYFYEVGIGVIKDTEQAEKWYRKTAESGLVIGQFNLGLFYLAQKRHQEAYEWFLRAAKQGHEGAAHNVAVLQVHGHCMPVNYKEAYRWFAASHAKDEWSLKMMETCKSHLSERESEQLQASAKGN